MDIIANNKKINFLTRKTQKLREKETYTGKKTIKYS